MRIPNERKVNTMPPPSLNVAIEAVNLAKEATSTALAETVFGSVSILLTTIREGFLLFPDNPFYIHM